MAAKRPVLASFDDGELSKLIHNEKCGLVSRAGDVKDLVRKIFYLFDNRDKMYKLAENGRVYVDEIVSKNKCVSQYIKVIEGCSK